MKVVPLRPFEKQLKRLAGKYPSLKKEILRLVEELTEDPAIGTSLDNGSYKIRIAMHPKAKARAAVAG